MAVVRKFWIVFQVFPEEYASPYTVSFAKAFTCRYISNVDLARKALDVSLLEVQSFRCLTVLPGC